MNRNRELLRSLLPGESVELVIPHQTHSDHVKVVDTIHLDVFQIPLAFEFAVQLYNILYYSFQKVL